VSNLMVRSAAAWPRVSNHEARKQRNAGSSGCGGSMSIPASCTKKVFKKPLRQRSAAPILCGAGYAVTFAPRAKCEGVERRTAQPLAFPLRLAASGDRALRLRAKRVAVRRSTMRLFCPRRRSFRAGRRGRLLGTPYPAGFRPPSFPPRLALAGSRS
jgi:hypothetical protein